tara:strand:+ start:630 stop:1562 length:933 start_codon:yes stop_codon:yes gene_type:complete
MSEEIEKKGWFKRLKDGLKKSSSKISDGIVAIVKKRRLDESVLEELEEHLIASDLGVETAANLVAALARDRFDQEVSDEEIRTFLSKRLEEILLPYATSFTLETQSKPYVFLVVGVNGSGKTTTIGKLASRWAGEGKKVRVAAGDTFRAAAVEQLQVWGERAGVPVTVGTPGGDPAGLAYEAYETSKEAGDDILLIDTAGRLQNRQDLMDELAKIKRVLKKIDPQAPHSCLLVLDATVGQNAHSQVDLFQKTAGVTGLVVTKLDGTAKGGVLIALAQKFELPIHAIGVGESVDDLQNFEALPFARSLMGL